MHILPADADSAGAAALPAELEYADDVEFISSDLSYLQRSEATIASALAHYHLQVNTSKTEWTTLNRLPRSATATPCTEPWRKTRKLGSLLGDEEDCTRRQQLASAAFACLVPLIRHKRVPERIRILLYNAYIRPILLYNCGTWGLTEATTAKLDAFHRQHLRILLRIHHPHHITNDALYIRTNSRPLSVDIRAARWKLFGQILQADPRTPANTSMAYYVAAASSKTHPPSFRGRPVTCLPRVLSDDLDQALPTGAPRSLTTTADLNHLRAIAACRATWRKLVAAVCR